MEMTTGTPVPPMRQNHVTVCICTYKRPALLLRTLEKVAVQKTEGLFSHSIVVADNDCEQSAADTVKGFAATAAVAVVYCVEPRQNIALVRNQVLSQADGEFLALIDDDEVPAEEWLVQAYKSCQRFGCAGILGPVIPYFDAEPPSWVTRGKFFERPNHPTGFEMKWAGCRTGNVLFRHAILNPEETPFREQFGTGGEDQDFFRRMIEQGHRFMWCGEAPVYELVPPARSKLTFLLKRALLRGSNFPKQGAGQAKNLVKSVIAVPAYLLMLAPSMAFGKHVFLKYLIKLLEHLARLMAVSGVPLERQRET